MHMGFALTTESSFDLYFDKNFLKILGHWLSLQTIARGILIHILPLWDIVATAFYSSSQHLLITVHFMAQLLFAGSHIVHFLNLPFLDQRHFIPISSISCPLSGKVPLYPGH